MAEDIRNLVSHINTDSVTVASGSDTTTFTITNATPAEQYNNMYAVVTLALEGNNSLTGGADATSITWNSISFTKLARENINNAIDCHIWYAALGDNVTATSNCTITLPATAHGHAAISFYSNVDQTRPPDILIQGNLDGLSGARYYALNYAGIGVLSGARTTQAATTRFNDGASQYSEFLFIGGDTQINIGGYTSNTPTAFVFEEENNTFNYPYVVYSMAQAGKYDFPRLISSIGESNSGGNTFNYPSIMPIGGYVIAINVGNGGFDTGDITGFTRIGITQHWSERSVAQYKLIDGTEGSTVTSDHSGTKNMNIFFTIVGADISSVAFDTAVNLNPPSVSAESTEKNFYFSFVRGYDSTGYTKPDDSILIEGVIDDGGTTFATTAAYKEKFASSYDFATFTGANSSPSSMAFALSPLYRPVYSILNLYLGASQSSVVYLGSNQVDAIYLGSNAVVTSNLCG